MRRVYGGSMTYQRKQKSPGRMIRQSMSMSLKIAALSPEAFCLFSLLLPHFDSYGKQSGNIYAVKGVVAPLIPYITPDNLPRLLEEISSKTNVKWWTDGNGMAWLHSISWGDHQDLRPDRCGDDTLPSWPGLTTSPDCSSDSPDNSGSTPGVLPQSAGGLPHQDKGEVQGEVQGEDEYIPPHSACAREEVLKIENTEPVKPGHLPPSVTRIPELIAKAWNRTLGADGVCPKVVLPLTHDRSTLVHARTTRYPPDPGWWESLFLKIRKNETLWRWKDGRTMTFNWLMDADKRIAEMLESSEAPAVESKSVTRRKAGQKSGRYAHLTGEVGT